MKIIETIREGIERLLKATQSLELSNRSKAALAYSPVNQDRYNRAAEQNARDSADLSERLRS
jgi:hypothetical protein